MRYGVFGGTFDPPHIGHLVLAAEALNQFGLDRVLWVLTPEPPHKSERLITDLGVRLEMLRAAIGEDPDFELSRVDIDRPPPHYAVDTMAVLRELLDRQDEFLGDDCVKLLDDLEFAARCCCSRCRKKNTSNCATGSSFNGEWRGTVFFER